MKDLRSRVVKRGITRGHLACQCSFGPSVQVSRLQVQGPEHGDSLSGPTAWWTPCPTSVIYDVPERLFLCLSFPSFFSQRSSKILSLESTSADIFANQLLAFGWFSQRLGNIRSPPPHFQAEEGKLLTFIYILVFSSIFILFHGYSGIYMYKYIFLIFQFT